MNVLALTKINKRSTEDTVNAFIQTHNLTFPNGKESNANASKIFNISSIPAGVIIKDGTVVWRGNPAGLKDEDYEKYL
jgi:hypothetical protein